MDRQVLTKRVADGPVRLHLNDGQTVDIPSLELCVIDELHAFVLGRDDEGKYRTRVVSLLSICTAENINQSA